MPERNPTSQLIRFGAAKMALRIKLYEHFARSVQVSALNHQLAVIFSRPPVAGRDRERLAVIILSDVKAFELAIGETKVG